jgi:hypothetical protein
MQIEQSRREMLRWQVLHILNYCRDSKTSERQLLLVIGDEIPDCSHHELRQELSYLQSKDLIEIEQRVTAGGKVWQAQIDAAGVDFVEYNSPDVVGIARPVKYWRERNAT